MKPRSELRSSLGEDHSKQMKLEMQRPQGEKMLPSVRGKSGTPRVGWSGRIGGRRGGGAKDGSAVAGEDPVSVF